MATDRAASSDVISVLHIVPHFYAPPLQTIKVAWWKMAAAGAQGVQQVRSGELLEVGSSAGLYSKLLLNSKQNNKNTSCSPIVRMPRSSILDRVQNFLPQMAQANENLSREIESSPARAFDIENIEKEEKIIEMWFSGHSLCYFKLLTFVNGTGIFGEKFLTNIALVELSSSESSEDEEKTSSDESSDSDPDGEVTEHNIRLSQKVKKGKIEVLPPKS
ncbi:NOP protein chaperone 1 isoform X1 [Pseudophryne corroboree]|uniref:NOP protein chaperone 1 isoform X1 n=1 Tax=Pseudophryne corroboree TaxID=495146 RepID=UPI00308199EB